MIGCGTAQSPVDYSSCLHFLQLPVVWRVTPPSIVVSVNPIDNTSHFKRLMLLVFYAAFGVFFSNIRPFFKVATVLLSLESLPPRRNWILSCMRPVLQQEKIRLEERKDGKWIRERMDATPPSSFHHLRIMRDKYLYVD